MAALMAMVKGSSDIASLDQMTKIIHLRAFAIEAQAYYEYVESKANWFDEISRKGTQGSWADCNGFEIQRCGVPTIML